MTLKNFKFNVIKKDNHSRTGLIETHRGNIKTPAFMPVGTQATVKACLIDDVINNVAYLKGLDADDDRDEILQLIAEEEFYDQFT